MTLLHLFTHQPDFLLFQYIINKENFQISKRHPSFFNFTLIESYNNFSGELPLNSILGSEGCLAIVPFLLLFAGAWCSLQVAGGKAFEIQTNFYRFPLTWGSGPTKIFY
jgi:hypothetical protein